jgi:hypothetical protein
VQVLCAGEPLDGGRFLNSTPRRRFAEEKHNVMSTFSEVIRELGAEFPGRKIRQPPHFIEWFVRWPGCDDALHPSSKFNVQRSMFDVSSTFVGLKP